MPNVDVNVGANVTLDASQAKSQIKSLEAELKSLTSKLRFEGATSNFSEITSKVAKLEKTFEDLLKYIPDKEIAKTVTSFNNLSNTFNTLASRPLSFHHVDTELQDIVTSTRAVKDAMNNSFGSQNISNIRANINELQNLNTRLQTLNSNINARGVNTNSDAQTRQLFSNLQSAQSNISTLANKSSDELVRRLKSGFKELESVAKKSFNTIYNISKTVVTKSASYLKSAFTSVLNSIGAKFKSIFSSSSSSGLAQQLKSLLLGAGVVKGLESAISLSSELTESQNRLDYVFGESAKSVTEFAQTTAKAYGLTENAATKFAATFGGILSASGIASDGLADFSENLTKMTGDLASFYDVDQDVFFKKLQAGLAGNAAALRTYGINVSATNLELYRMSKGIQTAYEDMDQASKVILRYNYIVESASQAQGDFARTQFTWANQIRLLKSQFQSLAAIIGGYFVKTLLPVVRILNQIVAAAINAFTALASLFGFDASSIKELTGGAKGTVFDESTAGYIDDTADALGNESKALDKTGKAAKEAADNLQGFDKLNNISSSSGSGGAGGGAGGGASGVGAGLKPLDWSSLTKTPDFEKTPLEKWFDEFFNLLKDKKWEEAGKSLAKQLNNITDTIYNKLTDPKVKTGINNFNDALTDFYDGLLDYDTKKLGQTFGAGINLIAYSINDLYEQAVKKDLLSKTGAKISDFFYGLATETKWEEVGNAFMTGFRTAIDILAGFIEQAKEQDLGNEIGTAIKDFLTGAVERLFGDGGAEEIGNNIAGLLNLAFDVISSGIGNKDTLDSIASGVVTTINTAIQGIDSSKLSKAISAILNLFATIFHTIGDIDTDNLSTDIADAINGAVDGGSIENLASGITSAITNIFNLIGETISKINWLDLGTSITKGISDGLNSTEGAGYLIKAFSLLFGVKLLSSISRLGLGLLGDSIVSTLADCILGSTKLKTLHTSVKGAILGSEAEATLAATGVGNSVAAAFNTVVGATLAITAIVATQIYNARKDVEKWHAELKKEVEDTKREIDATGKLSLFNTKDADMETFAGGLEKVTLAYNGLNESMRALATQVDSKNPLNKIEAGAQSLLNSDKIFNSLKLTIEGLTDAGYNNSEVMGKLQDYYNNGFTVGQADKVLKTIGLALKDCQSASEGLTEALKEGSDGANLFANSFSDGVVTARDKAKIEVDGLVTDLDGIKPRFSESGTALGQSMLSGVSEELSNDTTVDTATSNLITDATAEANSGSKAKGRNMMLDALSAMSSALSADTTVDSETNKLVTGATSESNVGAGSKGNTIGSNITAGVSSAISTNTSVSSATSNLVTNATSDANTGASAKGQATGSLIGTGLGDGASSKQSYLQAALQKLATVVSSDSRIGWTTKAKSAGGFIIDGIRTGLEARERLGGLSGAIAGVANRLLNKFKDVLGIHSPSRVFMALAGFIPAGIASGVESNAKVATNAIGNMCSSLSGEFENTDLNTNSLISVGKFDGMYDSLMRQTDTAFDYVASKFDNLRDMINLQSSLVVNPSVSRANLEAAYASASDVSGVVKSVGNIYSKLATSNLGSSNKPIQVNVYLDKNNKLSSYIINTVNGNTTKTGNF